MKELLIGLMILGSSSVFASEVDGCSFYFNGSRSESKIVKVMIEKGYVEAHNEKNAKFVVSSWKGEARGYFRAEVSVYDTESKEEVFYERNESSWFTANLSRVIRRLERVFPECK